MTPRTDRVMTTPREESQARDILTELQGPDGALAINTGFLAWAIAVFINTPSQPSSMAMAASEAVPTPASTSTGTVAWSRIRRRFHGLRMPMPEPISEASGMTATQPMSASMRH